MTILRWILATALAVAFLLLAVANWTPVPFRLPDGTMVNVRLPLLLMAAFIAGWLPTWLIHIGTKAKLNRRLAKAGLGDPQRNSALPSPVLPSQAQPIIVPPAGA
jgi:lipopolysaccharide assembly protein A